MLVSRAAAASGGSELPRVRGVCVSLGLVGSRARAERRGRRRTRRRMESATTALRDDDSGEVNGPGYKEESELRGSK